VALFAFKAPQQTTLGSGGGVAESKSFNIQSKQLDVSDFMSILQDPYAVLALASLIIQIVVLFLLVYGYTLKRKLKFRSHGIVMASAVILHLTSILAIMIMSFALLLSEFIIPAPFDAISMMGLIHGVAGSIAFALGVVLVAAWHFSSDVKGCFKRKNIMRVTITLWVLALVLGIALFAIFYGPLILG